MSHLADKPAALVTRLVQGLVNNIKNIFDLESTGDLLVYSVLVGVVAGLGAWVFASLLQWATTLLMQDLIGYVPPEAGTGQHADHSAHLNVVWGWVLLLPALGGIASGVLVYTFAPEAEGHGTDAMVRSFHRLQGEVRGRVPIVKGLASIMTIATGGSAGREGPIAQIGAGFGSLLADRLHLSPLYRRHLMLAGAAGGIAAIFRAPLGGALFVCEVLYGSTAVEFAAVVPAVISSVVAYSVFTGIAGPGHEFITARGLGFNGAQELPFYVVFAVLCAVVGYVYVNVFYGLRDFFKRIPLPDKLKPAIGGLLLGVLVLSIRVPVYLPTGVPHVMGGGYGWIQLALDGKLLEDAWWPILLLCLAKILATSLTVSSGGSGGVFAPSLFIGAMLGGAFGQLCHQLFPSYITQPEAFVLVGMGGFFAGVAKVPLTAVLMVSEMSGHYELIVPLLVVSIVNVAILSSRVTLYEEQVSSLIDSPAHLGDFVVDVLAGRRVGEVYHPQRHLQLVPQGMPLSRLVHLVATSDNTYFPVVDDEEKMVGIFSLSDIRAALEGNGGGDLIVALDIATTPVITVTPEDDLHTALRRFTQKNIDEIPVVSPQDSRQVLGMLRRRELISAYHDHMTALKHHRTSHVESPKASSESSEGT